MALENTSDPSLNGFQTYIHEVEVEKGFDDYQQQPVYFHIAKYNKGLLDKETAYVRFDNQGKLESFSTTTYTDGFMLYGREVDLEGNIAFVSYDDDGKNHGSAQFIENCTRTRENHVTRYKKIHMKKYEHGQSVGLEINYSILDKEFVSFRGDHYEDQKKTAEVKRDLKFLQFCDNVKTFIGLDKRTPMQQMAARSKILYEKYNGALIVSN